MAKGSKIKNTVNSAITPETAVDSTPIPKGVSPDVIPTFTGKSYANYDNNDQLSRDFSGNGLNSTLNLLKYNNLVCLPLPYHQSGNYINVSEIIRLCQKAYYHVSIFRDSIEIMTELANMPIKLRKGDKNSREFFEAWFKKIDLRKLKDQFFRECFRSGSIFFYRLDGGVKFNKIKKFAQANDVGAGESNKSEAARTVDIPLDYVLLNPADICRLNDLSLSNTNLTVPLYYQVIDVATKQRLLSLTKDQSVEIDIGKDLQSFLDSDSTNQPLDSARLHVVFYKKQDYEPFPIPMGFPVLEDLNLKLEFKKCDAVISKTVESIIMHVKHGNEAEKGGINPKVHTALEQLFKVKQTGRTVITDYTVGIDFIIPDLNKVLGKDKYSQVNQDILDGLMNIFYGEQKFANTAIRLRVFIERLVNAQQIFLDGFLIPEIKRISKLLEFDEYPVPVFEQIQLEDKVQSAKVIAQLASMGLLTAEETFDAMESGILPTPEQSVESQTEYKKLRDKQLYYPLLGGANDNGSSDGNGRPTGTKGTPATRNNPKPVGTSSANAIATPETNNHNINVDKFRDNVILATKLSYELEGKYKVKKNKKKLTAKDREFTGSILTHLITNEEPSKWIDKIDAYLESIPSPNINSIAKIEEIKELKEVSELSAAILMWSE